MMMAMEVLICRYILFILLHILFEKKYLLSKMIQKQEANSFENLNFNSFLKQIFFFN